jgi:putative membrane protein
MRGLTAMLGSYFKERKVLLGTIVGLFIPAIYCFLYLNAIWDPYGKADRIPAIIINQDQGSQLDGEPLQLGKELTDQLLQDKKLGWQVGTNEAAALERLKDGQVNVVITIPEKFSAGVAGIVQDSAAAPEPIRYYVNQGESLIVSQIGDRLTEALKAELNDKVSQKVMGKLIAAIGEEQNGFLTAADAAAKLADGAAQLKQGSETLAGSLQKARDGSAKLTDGAAKAADGSSRLSAGLEQLSRGNDQAAAQLQQGAQGVQQLADKLGQLAQQPGLPEPTKAALEQLAAQTKQLGASFAQGAQGAGTLAAGSRQAAQQSQQLAEGVKQLQQGLASLADGLAKGAGGSRELAANMAKLQDGVKEMQQKLQDAGNTPNTLKGKEALLTAPISIDKTYIHPVPNNGTFFTGFFAPLSLWVGAIVFCYLTTMVKWQGWARRSLIPRYVLLALLGVVQAVVLDLLLTKGLGLGVDDMKAFVLLTILTSLTFISLIHFIFAMTGVAGNLIVLILLVFQLGLSGGSYPVSMLSDINRHLSDWVPLTYAVNGFRIAISGGSSNLLWHQASHVLIFLAVGLGLHVAYGIASRIVSAARKRRHRAAANQAAA